MSLYTKDYLLDGKLLYYQPKNGYRSGIEPIILSGQIYSSISKKNILDMGAGCGPISLIISYRNPNSSVIGFEKNDYHIADYNLFWMDIRNNFYNRMKK